MSRTQTSSSGNPRAHPSSAHQPNHNPTQPFYNVQINTYSSILPTASPLAGPMNIPLNLLAQVIAHLDNDTPALARLCRTSRVLYYMTLPHLWKRVRLRSYKGFRNRDNGHIEGFGGGSPFSMGLNALVTHSVSGLVRELELMGERRCEGEEEEASQVGRVSENSMILGIAVRAALDKCVGLEAFKWDLDTRLMSNVFAGLSGLRHLERLWLRFPTTRCPGPTSELPVLPGLREFTFTNYDPLCYPDDMSRLLEGASLLELLHMHFSPRMREQCEPSVQLTQFFRRNIASRKRLKLRKIGIWNLFARSEQAEILGALEGNNIEEFTSLNSFGPDEFEIGGLQAVRTNFFDRSWLEDHEGHGRKGRPKSVRMDHLHKAHIQHISVGGLEKLYLINARFGKPVNGLLDNSVSTSPEEATGESASSSKLPTPVSTTTPASTPGSSSSKDSLRDLYFDSICKHAGPTLKHLIFPAKWPLSINHLARLIRSCPHLTQLSLALLEPNMAHLRMIVPFLKDLYALRIMMPESTVLNDCEKETSQFEKFVGREDSVHEKKLGVELASGDFDNLRYVGVGRKIWEVGGMEEVAMQVSVEGEQQGSEQQYQEEIVPRRKVHRVDLEAVKEVEIWKFDTLDVL